MAVARWPLAEVLACYIEVQADRDLTDFRHQSVMWQMRAIFAKKPGPKPKPSALLRNRMK